MRKLTRLFPEECNAEIQLVASINSRALHGKSFRRQFPSGSLLPSWGSCLKALSYQARKILLWGLLANLTVCLFSFSVHALSPPIVPKGEHIDNPTHLLEQIDRFYGVRSIALSPDGRILATAGSWDNTARIWCLSSGKLIQRLDGHTHWVFSVAFSPDGQTLATGSYDNTARLWDVKTGKQILCIEGHSHDVDDVAFSPDGRTLATGSYDKTARLWDVTSGKQIHHLDGYTNTVGTVSFSPDGRTLATFCSGDYVLLWDVNSGKQLHRLGDNTYTIFSVAFSPDGQTVAAGCTGRTARLWDVNSGKQIHHLDGHTNTVGTVVFSPDGRTLATGSYDKTARLWDVGSGKQLFHLTAHTDAVISVAFSPDGKSLATGSDDGTARLWDVGSGKMVHRLDDHDSRVRPVIFSPDGNTLITGSVRNTARLWDVGSGKLIHSFVGNINTLLSIAFSPDNNKLATASDDNIVRLWDVRSGKVIKRFDGHENIVRSVAFSPNGQILASGSYDNTVGLWDIDSGKLIHRLSGHEKTVQSVDFSADGRTLATGSYDNTAMLWDVGSGRPLHRLEGHTSMIRSVAFSPDGLTLATGSYDNTVRLWDVGSGKQITQFDDNLGRVLSIAFSPNGQTIATASSDNVVRLWDLNSRKQVRRLDSGDRNKSIYLLPNLNLTFRSINSIAFSPDGRTLATASSDNVACLWDIGSGNQIKKLGGHANSVLSVAFSPDGKYFASSSHELIVRRIEKGKYKLQWFYTQGANDNWLQCNGEKRCWRHDDGTLLLKNENGKISPLLPPEPDMPGILEIASVPEKISVPDNDPAEFSFECRNTGGGDIYWIEAVQGPPFGVEEHGLTFFKPKTGVLLKPGETKIMDCAVGASASRVNPQGKTLDLKLKITTAHGDPEYLSIPVAIQVPTLEIVKAELTDREPPVLQVSVRNKGGQDLTGQTDFSVFIDGQEIKGRAPKDVIKAGETVVVPFSVGDLKIDRKTDYTLKASRIETGMVPHEWVFEGRKIVVVVLWLNYLALSGFVVFGMIFLYYARIVYHPLTRKLSDSPNALSRLPLEQLALSKTLLNRTRRLSKILSDSGVSQEELDLAIDFFVAMDTQARCRWLMDRIGARYETVRDSEIPLCRFVMGPEFLLNLEHGLMAFPEKDTPVATILARLKAMDDTRFQPCVIVTPDIRQQAELRKISADPANWFVVPDSRDLTELLISPRPLDAFARLISSQVKVTRISPYQTRGGLNKDAAFFGRSQLLAHILHREPSSYIVTGGRQMGKSTLLKAIERRLADDPAVDCRYLVLGADDVREHLAAALDLPLDTGLNDIFRHLADSRTEKRKWLLIDEADLFVKADAANGYAVLKKFRGLSEEGRCCFILAGFWELYHSVTFDYQSPVKNFAETLQLGALEPDACRDLAEKPMALLNIGYESEALVDRILAETGGRANLIAIACDALLQNLDMTDRTIREDQVKAVLDGNAIRTALAGWEMLASDRNANRIDRIVVYATVRLDRFSLADLLEILERKACAPEAEVLRLSLERLELAFILRRQNDRYEWCVPLFRKIVLRQEPERMLENEIRDMKDASPGVM